MFYGEHRCVSENQDPLQLGSQFCGIVLRISWTICLG